MKKIICKNGEEVLVDDEDYKYLKAFKWRVANERGYKYAVTVGKVKMHRIIMEVTHNSKLFVDHINHNGLDNRRCNLRDCTLHENKMNGKIHKDNTTGYKGVYLNNQGKFYSKCKNDKITLLGGSHFSSYYAALDYNELAKKLHGEFACLNEITFEDKVKMFYRGEIHEFPKRDIVA